MLIRGKDTWTNRIHVDDLVTSFIAAWQRGGDGRVYNLADDQPHRASEFAELAADLHGLPRPEWVKTSEARRLAPERLRRKAESKRVRNRRLRDELEVSLAYPKYQAGLPAAVKAEKAGA